MWWATSLEESPVASIGGPIYGNDRLEKDLQDPKARFSHGLSDTSAAISGGVAHPRGTHQVPSLGSE